MRPRLLLMPLLIAVCTVLVQAQSSSDTTPSPFLSALSQENSQASIVLDQLQLPFRMDKKDLSHTMANSKSRKDDHAPFVIPPLESRTVVLPPFGESGVCYCIRGYRVARDDPESDSTRPVGYSTCQPAARFQVKDAGDLRETGIH